MSVEGRDSSWQDVKMYSSCVGDSRVECRGTKYLVQVPSPLTTYHLPLAYFERAASIRQLLLLTPPCQLLRR